MLKGLEDKAESTTEDLLHSILDSSFNGIMAFRSVRDSDYKIIDFKWIFVNDIAEKIVGIDKKDLLGAQLLKVMPGNKDAGLFQRYVDVVESESPDSFEQYYPSEQINKWFKIQAVPLNDGFTVTFQDITDLKEALQDSQVNGKKYQRLFEESLDAIFQIDQNFNLVEVSPSFEKLFDYPEDSLNGMGLEKLFNDPAEFQAFSEALAETDIVEEFETTLKDRSNNEKISIINCVRLSSKPEESHQFLGVIRDLTKRKRAELQLVRAEKLTMTGKLARTIAHEVRNPLTNLTLALDQLKDEVPEEVEDAELYFNIIERNAERIGKLISDLLNSSKPKELQLVKTNPKIVIETAVQLVTDRIKLKEMEIEVQFSDPLPELMIDATQLQVALLNLFINAIEAMKPGGLLSVDAFTNEKQVLIEIKDTGRGLSPEQIKNLFEPFYTDKKEGTGLGLLTVQNIINSHKGHIDVSSEPGKGSQFTISLPIQ